MADARPLQGISPKLCTWSSPRRSQRGANRSGDEFSMRILVVEDECKLAAHVCEGLREAGFCPDHAPALADAQILVATVTYEAIVLDLALPDGNGLDLLREGKTEWLKHGGAGAYRPRCRRGSCSRS